MNAPTDDLQEFRLEVRDWLASNFPQPLKGRADAYLSQEGRGRTDEFIEQWRKALYSKGYGVPTWPVEYGGAGLSPTHAKALQDELLNAGAFNHIISRTGIGIAMVGPTILEYGTEDQKKRHLPPMARGDVCWCLGYSEPNAGSDLASLKTKAEDNGDHWLVNGQKTWTSGAHKSQWCGALVRTDSSLPKRKGLSFVIFPMDQPGVEVRPIKLISGASIFCEMFFTDVKASKDDLLGDFNDGWSVGKRLLEHERSSQTDGIPGQKGIEQQSLPDMAKQYIGTDKQDRLLDSDLRLRLADHLMAERAHELTLQRIAAESRGNEKVTPAVSILKNSSTTIAQDKAELTIEIMGQAGLGWRSDSAEESSAFATTELAATTTWLFSKSMSIYGGSAEVQRNIISKSILGLPETTQKG